MAGPGWGPGPPPRGAGSAADAAAVRRYARASSRLTISPKLESFFATYVDGAAPTLCPGDLLDHPGELLALPPEVITRLYAELSVDVPTPTVAVQKEIDEWASTETVTLRRMTRSQLRAAVRQLQHDPDPLVISERTC